MSAKIKIALATLAAAALSGCGMQVRAITHTSNSPVGAYYVMYWEGTCRGFFGCSKGNSHVLRCNINGDNTATCVPEAEADKALQTPGE